MKSANSSFEQFQRDGVVSFRDWFSAELVGKAHAEVEQLCQEYFRNEKVPCPTSPAHGLFGMNWKYVLYLVDIFARCPTIDAMVEKILTDPTTKTVLERALGKNYKLRGYNIRRMHGNYDPSHGPHALPHEWHRDWPGEFTLSMLLTDVPASNNAGTAFVPGSHVWPYCPRKGTLLSGENVLKNYDKPMLKRWIARLGFFSRLLGMRKLRGAVESTGKGGDFFFFLNDTWHGRMPNLHGRNTIVLFVGFFPTEFPFPDEVKVPPDDVLAKLPARLRSVISHDQPVNQERDSLVHWTLARQHPAPWHSLFYWARLERRLLEWILVGSTKKGGLMYCWPTLAPVRRAAKLCINAARSLWMRVKCRVRKLVDV